ncbi:MAG: 4-(cytidine 5'-diphospho)-2-C-methyl-D-erythritol kinase [Candidatus Omnitrophota bacterium]
MILTAPAKINLYLKVLSKRDDGYHQIETLLERVSLADRLSVEEAEGSTVIVCNKPDVPTGPGSLMDRTVQLFRKETGKDLHFDVKLEKNIPIGAGLGGGSSDAAALLRGMNELAGSPLEKDSLLRISGELGADIPFFMSDSRFAYGKGRGDIIQAVDAPLEIWHVLVTPPFEVSTKDTYNKVSAFSLTNDKGVDRIFTAFLDGKDISAIAENLCNDLQAVTLRNFPALGQVFSELEKEGAKGVLLSGSGSTVFGIFSREDAEKAGEELKKVFPEADNWKVSIVRTC